MATTEVNALFGSEFDSTVPAAVTTPAVETVPAILPSNDNKVRREIDLGDGSGKQVFEADTYEQLSDILIEAQTHATKKIREQAFELKQSRRAKPELNLENTLPTYGTPKQLTTDEKFALSQELQNDPDAAFDKLLQAKTGMNAKQLADLGVGFARLESQRIAVEIDQAFLNDHQEDYLPTLENATLIFKFLQDNNLGHSKANLDYAFQELSEGGLLDAHNSVTPQQENNGQTRIEVKPHTRSKPQQSGISNGLSSATNPSDREVPNQTNISQAEVEEIYKLPVEEARVKMAALMARAKLK